MKPVHIQSTDATAGVLAEQVRRLGTACTWGQDVPPDAKYVVVPNAKPGEAQADRLTAGDILRGVRNAHDDGHAYECALFTVRVRSSGERNGTKGTDGTKAVGAVGVAAGVAATGDPALAAPLIAVGVSVHAAYLQYLPEALASVDRQTLAPCERWLLQDGCSYAGPLTGWRVESGVWQSPGPGRSRAVECTAAEWVCWLDADDALPADYLATMGRAAAAAGPEVAVVYPDLAYCDESLHHPQLRRLPDYCPEELPRSNCVPTPSLWRVQALREIGGWPSGTPVMDDWRAMMALRRLGWTALHVRAAPPVLVRKHAQNNSRRVDVRPVTAWHARRFAIVTLQAGRADLLGMWSEWLLTAELPPLCDLYVLDDSRSEAYREALRRELTRLRDSGRFGTVQCRQAGARVPTPGVRYPIHAAHARVASLYNLALPDALRCSDLALLFEDDVRPRRDSLWLLAQELVPNLDLRLAAVTGVYPCRGAPEHVSVSARSDQWRSLRADQVLPGLNLCGAVPGGFTLYDSQALLACLPMRYTYDPDGQPVGWDGNTARRLAAAGWKVAFHGDVRCEHLCDVSDGRGNASPRTPRSMQAAADTTALFATANGAVASPQPAFADLPAAMVAAGQVQ